MKRESSDARLWESGLVDDALGLVATAGVAIARKLQPGVARFLAKHAPGWQQNFPALGYSVPPSRQQIAPRTTDDQRRAAGRQNKPAAGIKRASSDRTNASTEYLGIAEFSLYSGIGSDQTIRNRIKEGRLVGWKQDNKAYILPTSQLSRNKRPIDGVSHVVKTFGDHQRAWEWLTQPDTNLEGNTPLSLLKKRQITKVQQSAQSHAKTEAVQDSRA